MTDNGGLLERQVFRTQDNLEETRERLVVLEVKHQHSPQQVHLDRLETRMMTAVDAKIAHVCDHLTAANREQSNGLTTEWNKLRTADREAQQAELLKNTQAILSAIHERRSRTVWWALGIVAAIVGSVLSTLIVIALLGQR